jgi:threonine dehydratase
MINPPDIAAAHERIKAQVRRTPVLALEAGALGLGHPLVLKLEQLQVTGSFKARGAFNSLLAREVPSAGVAAASGGNHGAAVAFAARSLGHPACIFVPDWTDPVKVARIRGLDAEVVAVPGSFDRTLAALDAFVAETGALAVHPFDQPETLAGQGTLGCEIEAQCPGLDTLLVSVGGGGLIGGITAWYAGRIRIVAVETEGTATLATALAKGPEAAIVPEGLAASALGATRIGALPYAILARRIADALLVTDAEIREAQRRLWDATRILAEPGGVTALAAVVSGRYRVASGERVGVLICGGNAAPDWFLS